MVLDKHKLSLRGLMRFANFTSWSKLILNQEQALPRGCCEGGEPRGSKKLSCVRESPYRFSYQLKISYKVQVVSHTKYQYQPISILVPNNKVNLRFFKPMATCLRSSLLYFLKMWKGTLLHFYLITTKNVHKAIKTTLKINTI